jgi:ABC-type Fe3+ transport system permease subunit
VATYLTFFPVTIAQARGLRSPDPRSLELMRSLAASRWDVYRKVRLPASVPYLFTALKVAAAAAIVGAIIGEGPGGVKDGLGRAIINFNQQYISGLEAWATILIASLTGIFFVCVRIAGSSTCQRGSPGHGLRDSTTGTMTNRQPPQRQSMAWRRCPATGMTTVALTGIDLGIASVSSSYLSPVRLRNLLRASSVTTSRAAAVR